MNTNSGQSLALSAIIIALPISSWLLSSSHLPFISWLLAVVLIGAFLLIVGRQVTGLWRGALIDDRNVISLSRFQMILWTLVVLSAYFAVAMWNMAVSCPTGSCAAPLAIKIPEQLWILIGISTTSLVGSPLILAGKKDKTADPAEAAALSSNLAKQGDPVGSVACKGQLVVNVDPKSARWSDMFTGEEVGNGAHLDLSRVQMFFFTVIVVLAYCVALGNMFLEAHGTIGELPELDKSITALLGISHAGYLTSKGVSHST